MKQRVAIGLSGGVDSSLAAALLMERGYEVTGVYITCWSGVGCRDEEDKKDALDVALQLKIPFVHLDFQKEYKEKVYEYMMREYRAGRTPNPDVMCNREIKFGLFYDWALRPIDKTQGKPAFDFVATGHYAQIGNVQQNSDFCSARLPQAGSGCALKNQKFCLIRSKDEKKDQTYFLWQLRQEQLAHILFPIGHLTKAEVRAEAVRRGLLTAKKPDSQGICFIGEVSVSRFLEERIEKKEGDILLASRPPIDCVVLAGAADTTSKASVLPIVGTHWGVWFYTVGQKIAIDQRKLKGFDQTNLPHFYVIKKDVAKNIIYVGTKNELYEDEILVSQIHWINEKKIELVRIRHGGELIEVEQIQISNDKFQIRLKKQVWGVAPGQSVVFYQENECLGGGIVEI